MKSNGKNMRLFIFGSLLMTVILDSRTAVNATLQGLELCIKTVIPGIFPILYLSSAISNELKSFSIPHLEHLLRMPAGTAGYFIIGLLCGYPVGAKLLQNAADRGDIDRSTAARMISFCNNASPAFIVGILSSLFSSGWIAIIMWLIQIIASFLVGSIIPGTGSAHKLAEHPHDSSLGKTMLESLKATTVICGWIILFGVFLSYIQIPIIHRLGNISNAMISGLLELTNGIHALGKIRSDAIRFTMSAVLLSFGGVCVILQTKSVAPILKIKPYLLSKLLHGGISGFLASSIGLLIFPEDHSCLSCVPLFFSVSVIIILIFRYNKKISSIQPKTIV